MLRQSDIEALQKARAEILRIKQTLTAELNALPIGSDVPRQTKARHVCGGLDDADRAILFVLLADSQVQ